MERVISVDTPPGNTPAGKWSGQVGYPQDGMGNRSYRAFIHAVRVEFEALEERQLLHNGLLPSARAPKKIQRPDSRLETGRKT
jgi:hypothetical protein